MKQMKILLLLAILISGACGGDPDHGKVIVLGLDGLDPKTVDLLMSEGKLPNFARLRQDGAYGKLAASRPLLSPVLWTTIATGRHPADHGIGHFVAIDNATGEELPATSAMRKVEAVWGIASAAERKVATVGWWATWPPEEVNGVVVSDHTCYHFLFRDGEGGGGGAAVTYPPEAADRFARFVRRPTDVGNAEAARFVDVPEEEFTREFDFEDELSHFRWALATAHSYADIGLELLREEQPDLLMVYIEGTDSTSHLFGHLFRAEGLAGELAAQQQRFGRAVEEIYLFADEILGRYMEAMDADTTLMVMSDHGFKLGELHDDPSKTRDLRRVSERYHREHGILYMYGRKVRSHSRIDQARQLDITPTLLTLLGLPPAEDMPGRVLAEALEIDRPPVRVASYEGGRSGGGPGASDSAVDEQILAHLKSLGYLDEGTTAPQGDRNLAAMEFEAGRYDRAAEIYRRLIAADPSDASMHTSLAGCLGAMERYPEALKALETGLEFNPLNVEAHHNRAVIYERMGQLDAAVEDYKTAVRYDPSYEPSRRALVRLTGTDQLRVATNAAEQRASLLSEQASQAARRGAYSEAMALLDEAVKTAPEYVLVHQYRANVAFLMGDLQIAEQALQAALRIEPGNALFAKNLESVRQQRAESGR